MDPRTKVKIHFFHHDTSIRTVFRCNLMRNPNSTKHFSGENTFLLKEIGCIKMRDITKTASISLLESSFLKIKCCYDTSPVVGNMTRC